MKVSPRFWRGYILLVLLLFLFFYNFSIVQKERLLTQGQTLILELAPVDPRSLMQGDYMTLRFELENWIVPELEQTYPKRAFPRKGRAVLEESDGEYLFNRLYDPSVPLGPNERLLEYTYENFRLKIGGGAFFFQEGLGQLYARARYALIRVDADGRAIIAGLLDENKRPLGKEPGRVAAAPAEAE